MIQLLSDERKAEGQRFLRAQLEAEGAFDEPPAVNEAAIRAALLPELVEYRGIRLRVAPVPYTDGVRLHALRRQFEAMSGAEETPETLREVLAALHECAAMFHRHTRPAHWVHRILWRVLPNPFLDATHLEIRMLLSFLWGSSMKCSVRLLSSSPRNAAAN